MGVGCRRLGVVLVLLGVFLPSLARIHLKHIVTTYLPYSIDGEKKLFGFDKGATEQIALDTKRQILYAVGNNNIFAFDVSDSKDVRVVAELAVDSKFEFEDVAVCGHYIYTTGSATGDIFNGLVKLFTYDDTTDPTTPKLEFYTEFQVGSNPDTMAITKDCRTIVVTLEGQASVDASDTIVDPEGGIGVIRWDPSQPGYGVKYTPLDFTMYNSKECELRAAGIRFVYTENFNTFSQDLEPEGVTLNAAETRAYITLQENNGIVVLDISDGENPAIIDIFGLGSKTFKQNKLDASIEDGGINFVGWPVRAFFQPDGIKAFIHDGIEYLITANEGHAKFYEGSTGVLFKEVKSGSMIVSDGEVDESVPESLKAALADNTKLGQLRFTQFDGKNPVNGKFKEFCVLGGRSFSLIRTSDLSMVFESCSTIGKNVAKTYPAFFNAKPEGGKTPEEVFDNQSPIGGNDPETVEVGEAYDKTLLFVGSEHPGTISIFSMSKGNSTPQFESVFFGAKANQYETWNDIYDGKRTGDIDPEDLIFVPKSKSVTGKPLLYVTGTVSGTVSCYSVEIEEEKGEEKEHYYKDPKKSKSSKSRKPHKPDHRERQRPGPKERQRPGPKERQRSGPKERQRSGPKERQRPEKGEPQRSGQKKHQRPETRERQRPGPKERQRPETRERQRSGPKERQRPETRERQRSGPKERQRPETRERQRSGPKERQRPEKRERQRPKSRKPQKPESKAPWSGKPEKPSKPTGPSESHGYYRGEMPKMSKQASKQTKPDPPKY